MDEVGDVVLVAGAGLAAGAVNAVAGGGTLITFPALVLTGMSPVVANMTSSVGLLAGYLGGSVAYRRELQGQAGRVRSLAAVSVLGGIAGAAVLLLTPAAAFDVAVPFLVLLSCALLAVQPRLARVVAARRAAAPGEGSAPSRTRDGGEAAAAVTAPPAATTTSTTGTGLGWGVKAGVFAGAVYGAYFGAGLGVLLLAVLGILVNDGLQRLNALKGLLSLVINAVGAAIFVASGRVPWTVAAVLAVAAVCGGLLGVRLARMLPARVLRVAVVCLGVVVAIALLVDG